MFKAKWAVFATALLGLGFQLTASTPTDADDFYGTFFYGVATVEGLTTDASVTILDPGANAPAHICANIYVLNPSEELEACCSVELTPDEIVQGQVSSLVTNLLNNNGLVNGVIKIISSSPVPGTVPCPSGAASITPVPNLRAWITRIDSTRPFFRGGTTGVSTTAFAQAPLSAAEETTLVSNCHFIYEYGSHFGQCFVPVEPIADPPTQECM